MTLPRPDGGKAARQTQYRPASWDPDDLLAVLSAESTLVSAWSAVRDADAEDGYLGRAVRDFDRHALQELTSLSQELGAGTYEPGRVTTVGIQSRFRSRDLTLSTVRDRVVERALHQVLTPVIDPTLTPFSFGYRRGLGVKDAIRSLTQLRDEGMTHVLRTDVRDAFDSLPRRRVVDALRARVRDPRVCDVVEKLLARLDDVSMAGSGIAQGSSLSPLLLNVYLDDLDRRILAAGFTVLRFADDIAIPTRSEAEAYRALDVVDAEVEVLGLALNTDKTEIETFDAGVHFLGTTIRSETRSTHHDIEHPRRISLVVAEGGAIVRTRHGAVRVDRDGETIAAISLSRVSQVVVQGRVGLTTPFLHRALETGIDVVLLTDTGGYLGRLSRRHRSDPALRRAQYANAIDEGRSLTLARSFVAGKIANQRVAVLREARQHPDRPAAARLADSLDRMRQHALDALTIPTLMGVEGTASRQYFAWLADRFDARWGFTVRQRRPPPDPVNSMLSYCYTVLTAEVIAACEQAGLDPDLGYLHSDRWGRPSLALDLVEEWRPVIVDSVVARIVTTGKLTPADFTSDPARGCRMSARAHEVLMSSYERRMLTKAASGDGQREAYRRLLVHQARKLAGCLVDGTAVYQPHLWR